MQPLASQDAEPFEPALHDAECWEAAATRDGDGAGPKVTGGGTITIKLALAKSHSIWFTIRSGSPDASAPSTLCTCRMPALACSSSAMPGKGGRSALPELPSQAQTSTQVPRDNHTIVGFIASLLV